MIHDYILYFCFQFQLNSTRILFLIWLIQPTSLMSLCKARASRWILFNVKFQCQLPPYIGQRIIQKIVAVNFSFLYFLNIKNIVVSGSIDSSGTWIPLTLKIIPDCHFIVRYKALLRDIKFITLIIVPKSLRRKIFSHFHTRPMGAIIGRQFEYIISTYELCVPIILNITYPTR